jgi:hypothetical protein
MAAAPAPSAPRGGKRVSAEFQSTLEFWRQSEKHAAAAAASPRPREEPVPGLVFEAEPPAVIRLAVRDEAGAEEQAPRPPRNNAIREHVPLTPRSAAREVLREMHHPSSSSLAPVPATPREAAALQRAAQADAHDASELEAALAAAAAANAKEGGGGGGGGDDDDDDDDEPPPLEFPGR